MRFDTRRLLLRTLAATTLTAVAATAAAQGDPIKIGVIAPTKTVAGQQEQQGAEVAAEMLNQQGGLPGGRQVQLIVYDSNMQPVDGVGAAQRLLNQDKVKFIAGEYSSTVALAVLQVARAADAMFVVAVPKHPDLTKSGYDKIFRLNTPLSKDLEYDNKRLEEVARPQKIAIVAENSDYGRAVAPGMKKHFGDRVIATELVELTLTDFSTVMTKVKASGADVVCLVTGKPEQTSIALRAMDALGIKAKKCMATGVLNSQMLRLAGSAAEGSFGSDIYVSTVKNAVNDEFVRRFQAKHGRIPEKVEALAFEAVWLTGKAIAAAGTATETSKVAATLRKGTWQTPRGDIRFEEGGQAVATGYINFTVKDGQLIASQP